MICQFVTLLDPGSIPGRSTINTSGLKSSAHTAASPCSGVFMMGLNWIRQRSQDANTTHADDRMDTQSVG